MSIKVMQVKGTQRAFYRLYVIPMHMDKKDPESAKALREELARHQKYVKDNNLQKELEEYIAAQEERQAKYDEMQKLKGEFASMKGAGFNQSIKELAKKEEEVENAIAAFEAAKEHFVTNYH